MFFFWKRWFFKRHRWKPWPVGKKHAKSVAFFFDVVCLFFCWDLFGMDFFGTPIIGLCPDLFFFPAKLGRW